MAKQTFANRLNEALQIRNIKPSELSKKTGIGKSSISQWLAGKYEAKQTYVYLLAKALDVNEAWLMGFDVDINRIPDEERISKKHDEIENVEIVEKTKLPFFDIDVAAGTPEEVEATYQENVKSIEVPNAFLGKYAKNKDIIVLRVNGESMNKVLQNKSLIAVKHIEQYELKDNDIVVFKDEWGYSIKRIFIDNVNNKVIFRPESTVESFTDYVISADSFHEIEIIGKVVMSVVNF